MSCAAGCDGFTDESAASYFQDKLCLSLVLHLPLFFLLVKSFPGCNKRQKCFTLRVTLAGMTVTWAGAMSLCARLPSLWRHYVSTRLYSHLVVGASKALDRRCDAGQLYSNAIDVSRPPKNEGNPQ